MSEWSVALDKQVALWSHCAPYTSFDDMRLRAWELANLDGEIQTPDEVIGDTTIQSLFFHLLKLSPQHVALYYFAPDTCQMLKQVAGSYPLITPAPPETCFLSDLGFWYFAEPLIDSAPLDANHRPLRMVLWHRSRTQKILTFVGLLDDPHAPLPLIFGVWPEASTIQQSLDDYDENPPSAPSAENEQATRAMMQTTMQTLGATVSFCHQRIFLDRREPADRAARRRAVAEGVEVPSDVHVMTLRRTMPHDATGTRDVEWNWRWWVRGHWRNQAVGMGRQDRVPVFVAPYVKGPEDRPMKPAAQTIYSVTR